MLTSSDPDQRSFKFGSVSNSSEWCFLLKYGRCRTATLMNRADFLRILHISAASLVHSYKIWLMIAPRGFAEFIHVSCDPFFMNIHQNEVASYFIGRR